MLEPCMDFNASCMFHLCDSTCSNAKLPISILGLQFVNIKFVLETRADWRLLPKGVLLSPASDVLLFHIDRLG